MKKKIVTLLIAGTLALSITACGGSGEDTSSADDSNTSEESSETDVSPAEEPEQVIAPYETDLTCGYYVAGVHIPEGIYNVTVNSGLGSIMTKSGVTSSMGSGTGVEYAASFDNLTLQNGDTLTVTQSLNIHLASNEAYYSTMSEYDNPAEEEKDLSAGNYIVGQDIQPGLYDVTLVSGDLVNINTTDYVVSTSLTNNEILKESTATSCKNMELLEGQTLSVQSGTVKMTPCADNVPLTPQ